MPTEKGMTLRIATRKSPLALWQAHDVKARLEMAHPDLQVEIIGLMTEGDRLLATPLAEIGGKGLFVKELEKAILERRADIAVHSIKDMPAELSGHLILAAVCEREDPRDAFVSNRFSDLNALPVGAIVGTASSRRTCLLKAAYPHLKVENLRGNVGTRLEKLDDEKYDAIILAAAGLKRLEKLDRVRDYLDPNTWIPAPGQGAIGIECHANDTITRDYLKALEHPISRLCIDAERAMNDVLGGSCQLPIGAYAVCKDDEIYIQGFVGDLKTHELIIASIQGPIHQAEQLGKNLGELLLARGADAFLC